MVLVHHFVLPAPVSMPSASRPFEILSIRALLCGAVNIVIVHNHPSGSVRPSLEGVKVTKKIKDASKLIGLNFCDHIIIGQDGYFGFSKANLQ